MSDISELIKIEQVDVKHPDCLEYRATLHIVKIGYIDKEVQYKEIAAFDQAFDRMKKQLINEILEIVNKGTIDRLDELRKELYTEARTAMFEGYTAKIDMAEKLGKLIMELRVLR
jgi:hypothetical protein